MIDTRDDWDRVAQREANRLEARRLIHEAIVGYVNPAPVSQAAVDMLNRGDVLEITRAAMARMKTQRGQVGELLERWNSRAIDIGEQPIEESELLE